MRVFSSQRWIAYLMIAPALLGLLLFVAFPVVLSLALSLTDLRLGSPLPTRFVGLAQYWRVMGDPLVQRALLNNLTFAAVIVPLQTGLALLVALLLNQSRVGVVAFRTLFFVPLVFPMSLVAVIWQLIYAPGATGPLNSALFFLSGGLWHPRDFLHDPTTALAALMALSIWQGLGLQMVILLAGLQGIPSYLYEAAIIDGAGPWVCFRRVTLPQLRNPLIFTGLMTTILSFRVFDQVQILTEGGPVGATTTLMYEIVSAAFERLQVGRASALTMVFLLTVLMLTMLQRQLVRQEAE